MKFKKLLTSLFTLSVAVGISMTINTTAMAKVVRETEPNNSMADAEEIMPNRKTAQEFLDANNTNSYTIKGYCSTEDEDWFKVYLDSSKDTYLTFDSDLLYFQIYDASGNPVTEQTFVTDATINWEVYDLNNLNLQSGNYYIKLIGNSKNDSSYQFLIGNPLYRIKSEQIQGSTITLSSSQSTATNKVNINASLFPEKSQVYEILINGVLSTSTSKVDVAYSKSNKTFSKTFSFTDFKVPLNYNYYMDGVYTFTYSYYKNKTFTPLYTFYYIYPVL